MGLVRTAVDTAKNVVKETLKDQSASVLRCDDMGNNILMAKKTTENGIIRNGSVIVVNPGQLAVIVDNGKVVDATAESGTFEFHSDAAPSFYAGDFKGMFKEMWTRFVFGGGIYQDQAVYFINVTEIIDNGFGTYAPVMYRDWEHCTADARRPGGFIPMRVGIRCSGNYTFIIDNPAQFLMRIGGTAPIYTKTDLCDQMRMEIVSVFQAVLNSLCDETNQVYPLDLPSQSFRIKELMDERTFDKNIRQRGIRIVGFNVLNVNLDEESKRRIDDYLDSGDFAKQQAKLNDAVYAAASNEAGAGVGFMNLNMMNSAMGGMFQGTIPNPTMVQNGQQNFVQSTINGGGEPLGQQSMQGGVVCSNCGKTFSGQFCNYCGTKAATQPQTKFCSACGSKVNGNFCSTCGAKQ